MNKIVYKRYQACQKYNKIGRNIKHKFAVNAENKQMPK